MGKKNKHEPPLTEMMAIPRRTVINSLTLTKIGNAQEYWYEVRNEIFDEADHDYQPNYQNREDRVRGMSYIAEIPKLLTGTSSSGTCNACFDSYTASDSMSLIIDDGHYEPSNGGQYDVAKQDVGKVVVCETDFPPPRSAPGPQLIRSPFIKELRLIRTESQGDVRYTMSAKSVSASEKFRIVEAINTFDKRRPNVIVLVPDTNSGSLDIDFKDVSKWGNYVNSGIPFFIGTPVIGVPDGKPEIDIDRKQGVILIKT